MHALLRLLTALFFVLTVADTAAGCERLSVCELDEMVLAAEHDWQQPVLTPINYRSVFSDSNFHLAAFMLCNAPGRLPCEEAAEELAGRFDSDACRQLYYVALVDGRGSGAALLDQPFKVVFAVKRKDGSIAPVLVSTPDDDTSQVNCHLTAVHTMLK